MENYLLGCDWGTSSFRLGLYSLTERTLIEEIQSGEGISGLHQNWQSGHYKTKGIVKGQFFLDRLLVQINILSAKSGIRLQQIPVLVSGMASSSIGIEDIPYARLPFRLDGSQVRSKKLTMQDNFPHEIVLISGVQSEHDVMRGEETQLIGIWSLLADRGEQPKEAIVIFPGTHSKHIYIKNGDLIDFKTFMTGEMYQVAGTYSILKDSIQMSDAHEPAGADIVAFKKGVADASGAGVLNSLFTVRTNQLFNRFSKMTNAFYLSGVLIGSELSELFKNKDSPLFLCGGKKLSGLYTLALEELGLSGRTTFVAADLVERAAMTGQKIIFDQYVNNTLLNE